MPYTIGIDARKLRDFGIGTYIRHLVRGLAEIDTENRYVLFCSAEGAAELEDLPTNFSPIIETSPVYSLREHVALSWKLLRGDIDLYHATHYVLPALVPGRIVVTIHDIIHLLYPQFLPSALALLYAQRMLRRSLNRGDRIIAASQNTKTDLMDYFGVDGRKIQVIYQGVDDVYRQRLTEEELDRRLTEAGLVRPYILFVGNPKPHKNLDTVIRAYARARELATFPEPLVTVGARDGTDFKIRQRAEQLGIQNHLHLVGYLPDELLPAVYQGASLFLFPTLYEGFGLPVIEAMASGVAVITSNNSALKEVAEGYARLVSPLEEEQIAHAIAELMSTPEEREALAKLGQKRAEDFRWDRTAERTLEVYRSALRGATAQGGTP